MKEIWKSVKKFEGLYEVSNFGNVRSVDRVIVDHNNNRCLHYKGKLLKPLNNGNGYLIVQLRKNGKRYVKYIHRIVAETFIGKIGDNDINHKDFNRSNNCVTNLEICTRKENINYSIIHDKYKNVKKYTAENKIKKSKNLIYKLFSMGMPKTKICKLLKIDIKTLKKYNINLPNKTTKDYEYRGKKVQCIETGEIFDSIAKANRKYNVTTVRDAISGRQTTSAGYHWKYCEF